jgi:hypothetical protein
MPQPNEEATLEQRARAVRYWEEVARPEMNTREAAKPKEAPFEALERLKAEAGKPVEIGAGLSKILSSMKMSQAA